MVLLCYAVIGVVVGALVWRDTRGTWRAGRLYPHIARCVLVTFCAAVLWPRTLLVAVAAERGVAGELLGQYSPSRR